VLVVDDDDDVRTTLQALLETEGHRVLAASNGREARALLDRHHVDVLVLDLAMGPGDGLWLLDNLGPHSPVIVVYSAFEYVTEAQVRRHGGSKIFSCLRKPVAPLRFLDVVSEAARRGTGV